MIVFQIIFVFISSIIASTEIDNSIISEFEFAAKEYKSSSVSSHPSVVMIIKNEGGRSDSVASGNLLSQLWVLTVANCLFTNKGWRLSHNVLQVYAGFNDAKEYVGKTKPSNDAEKKNVEISLTHPSYICCSYDEDNLALIKVKTPFKLSSVIGIMTLSARPLKPGTSHSCVLAGFGIHVGDHFKSDDKVNWYNNGHLKERSIHVTRKCDCHLAKPGPKQGEIVKAPVICQNVFGNHTSDYGYGDFGAGLICDGKLYGLLSMVFGSLFYQTCSRGPIVNIDWEFKVGMNVSQQQTYLYTDTCVHLPWIHKVTRLLTPRQVKSGGCSKLAKEFNKRRRARKESKYMIPENRIRRRLSRGIGSALTPGHSLLVVLAILLL